MPAKRKKHPAPPPGAVIEHDAATKETYSYHGGCVYRLRPTKGWLRRRVDYPEPDYSKLNPLALLFMKWGHKRGFA